MPDRCHRGLWLLLDPPTHEGFARRVSVREKTEATKAPFPSIDLILLSGHVLEAGFQPLYIDAQIRRWSWEHLRDELAHQPFQGVVSLISTARIEDELTGLRLLKGVLGDVPVYIVGPINMAITPARPQTLLGNNPWLDGIILNTAEHNFGEVISTSDATPQNIFLRRGGQILTPEIAVNYGEGFSIPQPVHSIFKDSRYFFPQSKRTPVTCSQMGFGCPYTCEFCLDNALYRKMRYRDVNGLIAEMIAINEAGFREVYFKDLTFGLNKRVTTEFLERLEELRLKLRWLCTTRVDVATPKLLNLMKRAGCYGIEFGVESGVRHRRAANGKPVGDDPIREMFANCRRLGIETTAFVMIGFEDETEEEIRTTMRFIESLGATYASYNVVNVLPGTPLEARARREGFLKEGKSDHTFAVSNIRHQHLTPQRLEALRSEAVKRFYRRPVAAASRLLRLRSFFELRKLVKLSRVAV